VVNRQRALVHAAGLPDALPVTRFSDLWNAMQHDKKMAAGRLHCVLPEQVGQVRIAPVERSDVKEWFAGAKRVARGQARRAPRGRRARP